MAQDREIRSKADPAGRPARVACHGPAAWLEKHAASRPEVPSYRGRLASGVDARRLAARVQPANLPNRLYERDQTR